MMDINQTIKLWASLSPRLLRGESDRNFIKEVNPVSQKIADALAPSEEVQLSASSSE